MQEVLSWRRMAAVLLAVVATAPAPAAVAADAVPAAYAKRCADQSRKHVPGSKQTRFAKCVVAMARLAEAKTRSPRVACAPLPRKGSAASPFARCVKGGTALIRNGNGIDRAFVDAMIPHHEDGVELAELAVSRGQSDVVRNLAASIIRSQTAELATLRKLRRKLVDGGMKAADLGLSRSEMGMDDDPSRLAGANPFDLPFLDMMIAHHQGAITMSNVLVDRGAGSQTRRLARQIKRVQTQELEVMRTFRVTIAPPTTSTESTGHGP